MRRFEPVLVLDDDTAMREMVSSLLREEGFDVEAAMGADDALDRLRAGTIRVVLCEVQMPGKSGFDFLGEARRVASGIPVILMTSFGGEMTADRAKSEGAFDCLSKPFSREELLDVLARALPEMCQISTR